MFETSGDILNMALAMGFIVLVIFLCMFIFYGIIVLRDIAKVAGKMSELVTRVHSTIVQPLKAVDFIIERFTPYIEAIVEKRTKSKKSSKK